MKWKFWKRDSTPRASMPGGMFDRRFVFQAVVEALEYMRPEYAASITQDILLVAPGAVSKAQWLERIEKILIEMGSRNAQRYGDLSRRIEELKARHEVAP